MAYSDLTPAQKRSLDELYCKPFANNERLEELFQNINKVVIKKGGVYDGKAIGHTIELSLESKTDIDSLIKALHIEEPKEVVYCMCAGSYALELFNSSTLKGTIGLHHGRTIRYEGWKGDARLVNGLGLLTLIASRGYKQPLKDFMEDREDT